MKLLRIGADSSRSRSPRPPAARCSRTSSSSPTEPSDDRRDVRSYLGTWTGPDGRAPSAQSCGSLQWKITSQTGSQASGDFSATCADGVSLAGTMTATHGDTSIPVGGDRHGHEGHDDVPLQHDRYRHLPGHVEHPRELRRHVVQRAGQRHRTRSSDRDVLVQVDVLDRVEQLRRLPSSAAETPCGPRSGPCRRRAC